MKQLALLSAAVLVVAPFAADASCRIRNDTKYSFTVESGNTSNQSLGARTTMSIAAGKILAKSKDGKSFGGSCKDGDVLEVTEEGGVVVLSHK
jgi:putative salt-induced outer membrane protein YdiY